MPKGLTTSDTGIFNMQITASIFKAYDIRGTFPKTLDEALAEGILA